MEIITSERVIFLIEQDTIKLLRECDAGVKMGTGSIDDVLAHVSSDKMAKYLTACRDEHLKLGHEIEAALNRFSDDGKDPNPMAKTMSYLKTEMKLAMEDTDSTVADLMTDGCNMGVKSLNRYLNEYKAADETAKDICKRLINLEERLAIDLRQFL